MSVGLLLVRSLGPVPHCGADVTAVAAFAAVVVAAVVVVVAIVLL